MPLPYSDRTRKGTARPSEESLDPSGESGRPLAFRIARVFDAPIEDIFTED